MTGWRAAPAWPTWYASYARRRAATWVVGGPRRGGGGGVAGRGPAAVRSIATAGGGGWGGGRGAATVPDVRAAGELLLPLARRCGQDLERFLTEIATGAETDALDPRAE